MKIYDVHEADLVARQVDLLRCRGELQDAKKEALRGLASHGDNVRLRIALGRVFMKAADWEGALEQFSTAADQAPDDARPAAWRIAALSRQHCYESAHSAADEALARFSDSVQVAVTAARVYLDENNPREALRRLDETVSKWHGDRGATLWQAACRARLHDWEAAEREAQDAVTWAEAERDARDAIRRYSLAKAYCGQGQVLVASQHYAEAVPYLRDAIDADPDYPKPWEWLISARRGLCEYEDAEKAIATATRLFPRAVGLHIEAAWLFSQKGDHDNAVRHARQACENNEMDPAAQCTLIEMLCNAYQFSEAERAAGKALALCPGSARVHTAAALACAEQRKWEDALGQVADALAADKSYWWALRSQVEFLRRSRQFEAAERAAIEAVGKRDYDPRAYIAKGWVFSRQGKYGQGIEAADEALKIDPRDSWALCSKINFLRQACRFAEARRSVTAARTAWPNDPDVLLAAAWVASDQDDEEEAGRLAQEALGIDPYHASALAARLHFLRWARKFDEAEKAASDALRMRPGDPNILAAAGWVYSDRDKHEDAIKFIERAIAINRYDSWLVTCHVNFLRAKGEHDAARRVIEGALARTEFSHDPFLLTVAGWLHGDRDDYEAALAKFEQALKASPAHMDALQWKVVTLRRLLHYDSATERGSRNAMTVAREAVADRPLDAELTIELGRTCDARNEFSDALAQYNRILADDRDPQHVDALVAKSSVLRSQRRYRAADREVSAVSRRKPTNRDLIAESGWILYDQRNFADARAVFHDLLAGAVNGRERALAHYGLGWVAFGDQDYIEAESQFSAALHDAPDSLTYELGLAWALSKQDKKDHRNASADRGGPWDRAEEIARRVTRARPDPVAHACLGFLAFRRDELSSAEYHLTKAVDLDPYHGSYTDLGAFYLHTARYEKAKDALTKAIARDWHDAVAHVEMGCVYWELGDGYLADAAHEFQQAHRIDPGSVPAVTGLARTLVMQGNDADAEDVLRDALTRIESRKEWRVHLALARLLARQGIRQQEDSLLQAAFTQAQEAIKKAPKEKDPQVAAGVVQFHWASLISEPVRREYHYGRARRFLNPYRDDVPEAMRYLAALKGERSKVEPAVWGGGLLAIVSLIVLLVMWGTFFLTSPEKVSEDLLIVNTPVLLGLVAISALLPALIRLKVPGFEADLQPGYGPELIGPTGDDSFGPGRLAVPTGPVGTIGQLGDGRVQHAKNTRHF